MGRMDGMGRVSERVRSSPGLAPTQNDAAPSFADDDAIFVLVTLFYVCPRGNKLGSLSQLSHVKVASKTFANLQVSPGFWPPGSGPVHVRKRAELQHPGEGLRVS